MEDKLPACQKSSLKFCGMNPVCYGECRNTAHRKEIIRMAIIDEDAFGQVQALLSRQTRPKTHMAKPSGPVGLVMCADCQKQMQRTTTTKDGKAHYYFRGKANKQFGRSSGTSHLIAEDVIVEVFAGEHIQRVYPRFCVNSKEQKKEQNIYWGG